MVLHVISVGSLFIIILIAMFLFGPKHLSAMLKDLSIALQNLNKTSRTEHDVAPKEFNSKSLNDDSP